MRPASPRAARVGRFTLPAGGRPAESVGADPGTFCWSFAIKSLRLSAWRDSSAGSQVIPPFAPPSGKRVQWEGMDVIPFEDGLVKRKDVYSDSVGILRQVGLLES